MRLEGKRILITGGGSGLGAEYARALRAEGASIAIGDINEAAATAMARELGGTSVAIEMDVGSRAAVKTGVARAVGLLGGLDILVNNAGLYPHRRLEKITFREWRRIMRTNLDGVFLCTSSALPFLKAAGGGKVINVVTNLVQIMAPLMGHYIASKAGVLGFTRGAARELAEIGITINALAPGANMPADDLDEAGVQRMQAIVAYQAIRRPQFACDLTGAMVFLCSADSDFMTGQVLCVDGGVAVF